MAGEPCIVTRGEIILVGVVGDGSGIHGLWTSFGENKARIKHVVAGAIYEVHAHAPDAPPAQLVECMVGSEVTAVEDVPAGLAVERLSPATYAVFAHQARPPATADAWSLANF